MPQLMPIIESPQKEPNEVWGTQSASGEPIARPNDPRRVWMQSMPTAPSALRCSLDQNGERLDTCGSTGAPVPESTSNADSFSVQVCPPMSQGDVSSQGQLLEPDAKNHNMNVSPPGGGGYAFCDKC